MTRTVRFLIFALVALGTSAAGFGAVLYDGSLGTSMASQGYLTYPPLVGTPFTQNTNSVELNTTSSESVHFGFWNYTQFLTGLQNSNSPTLDHNAGYTIDLSMQTVSETHDSTNDRAGFSLIAISSDDMGIEIGFWENEVFAQSSTFSPSQTAAFNTENATNYTLSVSGSNYTLFAGSTQLLTGPLQNYSGYGAVPNVYADPNFIFIGDDTTEADADNIISYLDVTVPEPTSASLLILSATAALYRRRRSCR